MRWWPTSGVVCFGFTAARWTALHRATESARPDALFRDPLAERLAGEHGRAIVAAVPRSTRNGWWLVARTKIIDDAIAQAIADGLAGAPCTPKRCSRPRAGSVACRR